MKKILSVLICIFGILGASSFILCLGGGGVLNDTFDKLEKDPNNIELLAYIQQTESLLLKVEHFLFWIVGFFFFTVLMRILLAYRVKRPHI